jgi:uncharacterized protein YjeT (DUF2065 family)
MKMLLCLLGLVLIVEGLPYFAFPERMKQWMRKVQQTPAAYLRATGGLAMGVGLLLTYLFKQ